MAQATEKEKVKVDYIAAIRNFFDEEREEIKKVVWPTRETLIQSTITVLVVLLAVSAGMAAVDFVLGNLLVLIR